MMVQNQRRLSIAMAMPWARVALCAISSICLLLSASALAPVSPKLKKNSCLSNRPSTSSSRASCPLFLSDDKNRADTANGSSPNSSNGDGESEEFEKAVRVAKAKADIDRILKGPDAPFDLETELQKVEGISPPLASKEQQLDDQVGELEADLYAAVEQENFALANEKKNEIGKMHMDDCGAVLQCNSAFYRAFSDKDYDTMEKLWLKDASALCIHPSHAPIVGANAVLKNWKSMFDTSNGSFQRNWMSPSHVRLTVKGATAIVTCDEEVYCRRFVRGKKRQTELINKLTATNIFRKVDSQWFMVHHHSSWHADSDAAKAALKGGGSADSIKALKDGNNPNLSRRSKSDEIGPDGILGNFGPILGGPSPSSPPQEGSRVKRIVMGGSLEDLLNGGLNDLLSGSGTSDDQEDGEEGKGSIIQFHQLSNDGSDGEDNDGEDGDDGDDNGTGAVSLIKHWAKSQDDESSAVSSSSSGSLPNGTNGNAPKDALRQNCISALRKLCNQGSISPKQKRVLLTDIIKCSAKGEFSMVEVAYELLCGEGDDKDAAAEEFADQCRVFAHSLPDSPCDE